MINELKSKTRQVKETRLLKQDEVYNGALEDILLGKILFLLLLVNLNLFLVQFHSVTNYVYFFLK